MEILLWLLPAVLVTTVVAIVVGLRREPRERPDEQWTREERPARWGGGAHPRGLNASDSLGAMSTGRMSQRTLAGLIAAGIAAVLLGLCFLLPLPYVVYRPGVTVDVLGESDGKEIVQVEGAPSYPDDGEMRMVTVSVTSPETKVRLPGLMAAWLDRKDAVYPFDSIYSTDETNDDSRAEGAAQMASSQDVATAVALRETGVDVPEVMVISDTVEGQPADGVLEAGDIVVSIDDTAVTSADQG